MIRMELIQCLRNPVYYITGFIYIITFTMSCMLQNQSMHADIFQMNYALSIQLLIVPLFILAIGSMAIAYHNESGWLQLLKTYPMKHIQYIASHYISLVIVYSFILAISIVMGLLLNIHISMVYILLSFVMILLFASIAVCIGIFSKNRLHAIGIALCSWTIWLLLIPFGIIAMNGVMSRGALFKIMIANIHLNPSDLIRLLYYVWTDQLAILGPGFYEYGEWITSNLGQVVLYLNVFLFVLLPLIFALFHMRKVRTSK
ncbi:ABC transporter permease [Macrococcus animalis]|uniref:ABC transporter permease n=2 Tax=Macrococcus animalis TaxID=3395467 RepID=UPI0039BE6915